jgi:sugar-specific transcriptional regulator TrmB
MELKEILGKFGLTDNETKVYIKLLTIGESTASNLGKETGIERRTVYDVIQKLLEKGLISFIKENDKKFYKVVNPLRIVDILNEKEENLRKIRQDFVKLIPNLEELIRKGEKQVDARILFGREGIKTMYMDEIKEGKTVYAICTTIDKTEELLKNFLLRFTRERIRKKINLKMLSAKKEIKFLKKYKLVEVRSLPEEYASPASLTIYRDKLGITLWADNPITVLIKNQEIANNFLNYFELMWRIGESVR